jgi:hypothetical protein
VLSDAVSVGRVAALDVSIVMFFLVSAEVLESESELLVLSGPVVSVVWLALGAVAYQLKGMRAWMLQCLHCSVSLAVV